ncbi:unnamed protein product, partial [Heterosigma akashiwo]
MFVALSIVVDEYFCAALTSMVETWKIKEDVAGATFMAAGGSAPELFTSIMGVFFSKSDVGFGTIIGSAVFNVLFVIGLCAVFAREVLQLTWWPLFRDCSYYICGLCVLAACVWDEEVHWYEALILFCMYILYCTIMYFNEELEAKVKRLLGQETAQEKMRREGTENQEMVPVEIGQKEKQKTSKKVDQVHPYTPTEDVVPDNLDSAPATARRGSRLEKRRSTATMVLECRTETARLLRRGSFEKGQGRIEERLSQSNLNIGTARKMSSQPLPSPFPGVAEEADAAAGGAPVDIEAAADNRDQRVTSIQEEVAEGGAKPEEGSAEGAVAGGRGRAGGEPVRGPRGGKEKLMGRPRPLLAMFYFTIPNCGEERWAKYFLATFGLSLVWIAIVSYLMVWWVAIVAEVVGVNDIVLGLTVLAAGTSIPDALSSVIMARLGHGDMAVSSSIGSNVFDILVGLPVPWFVYTAMVHPGATIAVSSPYLVVHTIILLGMVFAVIVSIMARRWRLDMMLGGVMGGLYFVFLVLALFLE